MIQGFRCKGICSFFCLLLLPEQGEQSEQTNEQIPLFLPLRPGGHSAGTSPLPTSKVLLSIPRNYIPAAVPSDAAQKAPYPVTVTNIIESFLKKRDDMVITWI